MKCLSAAVTGKILVVDDNETNRLILEEILSEDHELQFASSGEECVSKARAFAPDLILLDIMMPGMDGYEACRQVRAMGDLKHTKVIMVSAKAMLSERLAGYRAGADDYICKPFDDEELASKARVFLRLKTAEESMEVERVLNAELEVLNDRLTEEVARRRQAEEQLRHDALHDVLTNLPNRALLLDRTRRCLMEARENEQYGFSILFMDLDDFKVVNDCLGHHSGDHVLVEVSRRLLSAVRASDTTISSSATTTARMGGDEFVVLLEGVHDGSVARTIAERISDIVSAPMEIDGQRIAPQVSIGIAISKKSYEHEGEILRDADTALYHAKELGKGRVAVFDDLMHDRVVKRMRMENELVKALEGDQLYLEYQPIVCLSDETVRGFEALVRWNHPERGTVLPGDFIPLAEASGLIAPLGVWVMREACRQVAYWKRAFPNHPAISVSVNVSGRELSMPGFAERFEAILDEAGLGLQDLYLELTETVLLDKTGHGVANLQELAANDVGIHMDDFGTGYSSLSYLSRLPISGLKLDRSFVNEMTTDPAGATTIKAILDMAHSRGLKVVAEGTENQEQVAQLKALGCDLAQGYFFSRPVAPAIVERMLAVSGRIRPLPA